MKTITESEALNKAAAYCTPCERCTHEVVAKLKAWGVTEEAQQRIIERLKSENFINEERYSRAFVNDKLRFNQWGRIKIQAALREKQIDRENINNAIAAIDDDTYIAIMKKVIALKHKELKYRSDRETTQKVLRFAASRGFEPHLIIKSLNSECDEMDF